MDNAEAPIHDMCIVRPFLRDHAGLASTHDLPNDRDRSEIFVLRAPFPPKRIGGKVRVNSEELKRLGSGLIGATI